MPAETKLYNYCYDTNHTFTELIWNSIYVNGVKHYTGTDPVTITNVAQIKARNRKPLKKTKVPKAGICLKWYKLSTFQHLVVLKTKRSYILYKGHCILISSDLPKVVNAGFFI